MIQESTKRARARRDYEKEASTSTTRTGHEESMKSVKTESPKRARRGLVFFPFLTSTHEQAHAPNSSSYNLSIPCPPSPLPIIIYHPLPPAIRSIRNVFIDIDLLALLPPLPLARGGRRDEIYGWHLANGNGEKMQMAKQYAKIYSVICNLHEI